MCELSDNFNKYGVNRLLDKLVKIMLFYNNNDLIWSHCKFTVDIERFNNRDNMDRVIRINLCNYEVDGLNLHLYSEFLSVEDKDNIDEYNLLAYVSQYLNECGEDIRFNLTVDIRD